ncbi:MAG TPA: PSD1 and planctomycete cytochrome C domain-containing protein [Tepidisphaeraceae bacterium]|nr:PSD1 and planctomycete cytochrome C domain-containing protein [Tepidisphaeraceae bacterium]
MRAHAAATPTTKPAAVALTKEQTVFFETKIRPIFVNNCYECHSVQEHKAKGGLVLDSREGWMKGGKHGPVITPGDPSKSFLIKAINYGVSDFEMPPDEKLKPEQIALLTQWIKMGAPDPRVERVGKLTGLTDVARAHWSYQPVKNPPVPATQNKTWAKTPIDSFILAKLESKDMKPAAPASKETLIRRATYDLIGLPPSPEEVADFVNDPSPNAFAKVVDRLLASPHYGERWGRYWLDTARYSDTTGAEDKKGEYRYPFAWTYRDYVINAFNSDKPYDQFIKEQLAADLMPLTKDDASRQAALGFLTVGKRFANPNDTIDERIDAVTKGTMAVTVSCARCHDHKFDPIPQADYYSLHGIFASTIEPSEKPIVSKNPKDPAYVEFAKKLAVLEQKDRDLYYNLVKEKSEELRKNAAAYLMVEAYGKKNRDADMVKKRNEIINKYHLDRGIWQSGAANMRRQTSVFGPMMMFANIDSADFATAAKQVLAKMLAKKASFRGPINSRVLRAFAAVPPDSLKSIDDVAQVYGQLFASIDSQAKEYLEKCRISKAPEIHGYDDDLVELFNNPVDIEVAANLTTDRLTEIAPTLPVVNRKGYDELILGEINEFLLTDPGSPPRAMVVADSPKPHNSPIFIRGDAAQRGQVVPRRFLEVLSPKVRKPFTNGSGRLELAEAIVDPKNPLTARTIVNRIWMHHFGQAFVRTPDDLGVQCEDPSHPALLDYLARRFMQDGWSIKKMHRLIMLSSVYQESSETNSEYENIDPDNRLLWRANLRKLDFEAVRDSMLVFTGELDEALGGKPVNLTDEPYSDRRSVYGYIDRGKVPELMSQFDFADPDMANSKRTSTIVPQQALFYMNSPMAVNVARKVTRLPEFTNASTLDDRVKALYTVLYQREPQPKEIEFARAFLKDAGLKNLDSANPTTQPSLAMQKQREREARIEEAMMEKQREKFQETMAKQKHNNRSTIKNSDGDFVLRKQLTPWEQYAQALLFTNEIAYVN